MATGDQQDMIFRLRSRLPPSWFTGDTPVLDTALSGLAVPLAWAYALYAYVLLQARMATATGVWLDRAAYDFFGFRFRRKAGEPDASFRVRIPAEITRPRGTRPGILRALKDLTGRDPVMVEFTNPQDCGSYRGPYIGYGVAGHYGSVLMPCQSLLTVYRPSTAGIPEVPGYGSTSTAAGHVLAGYGLSGKYADLSEVQGQVTDADIYAAVAATQAAGTTTWTQITS